MYFKALAYVIVGASQASPKSVGQGRRLETLGQELTLLPQGNFSIICFYSLSTDWMRPIPIIRDHLLYLSQLIIDINFTTSTKYFHSNT